MVQQSKIICVPEQAQKSVSQTYQNKQNFREIQPLQRTQIQKC